MKDRRYYIAKMKLWRQTVINFYQYLLKKTQFTGISKNSTKILICLFTYTQYCLVVQFAADMMPFDGKKLVGQKWVFKV